MYLHCVIPASACCSISSYVQHPADATAWLRYRLLLPCILQVTALLLQIRTMCAAETPYT